MNKPVLQLVPKKEAGLLISEIFGPTVQGEGPSLGKRCMFLRLAVCNLSCDWCIEENTPILMADWSYKLLKDVEVGDWVMGVHKPEEKGLHLVYTPSLVQNVINKGTRFTVKVSTDRNSVICTPEHKFLAFQYRTEWYRAESLEGKFVRTISPNSITEEFKRGWLSGYLAGDGSIHEYAGKWMRLKVASIDPEALDRFEEWSSDFGLEVRRVIHQGNRDIEALECTHNIDVRVFKDCIEENPTSKSYAQGWLGGFYDAEGHLDGNGIRMSQSRIVNPEKISKAIEMAKIANLHMNAWENNAGITTLLIASTAEFLSLCYPAITRKYPNEISFKMGVREEVKEVIPVGSRKVMDLTTSTGNFIAGGFIVHNCDTKFTWDWKNYDYKKETKRLSVDQVYERIRYYRNDVDRLVISGGEPLLQQHKLELLLPKLERDGWKIEIETAGTIVPSFNLLHCVSQFNVSPKLEHSGNPLDKRFKPQALREFVKFGTASFKFVIQEVEDLKEVMWVCQEASIPPEMVYIMPEGTTRERLNKVLSHIIEPSIQCGFNVTTRLHVMAWGEKRGV